jgi:methionyl aminopeptidase
MNYIAAIETDAAEPTSAIKLHGPEGFEGMRKAGRLAAEVLDMLVPHVKPGVTTGELDRLTYDFVLAAGAVPATVFYRGYSHSLCTSINHVVCHGIPSAKKLVSGDIVNIDVTVVVDGWHGDTSRMYLVGDVPLKARRLVEVTYECLMRGIAAASPARLWVTSVTPSRRMPKASAIRWCATSAAMAWGGCSTTPRTSSMSASPARAWC